MRAAGQTPSKQAPTTWQWKTPAFTSSTSCSEEWAPGWENLPLEPQPAWHLAALSLLAPGAPWVCCGWPLAPPPCQA